MMKPDKILCMLRLTNRAVPSEKGYQSTEMVIKESTMKKKYLFLMRTRGYAGAEQVQMDYLRHIDYTRFSVTLGVVKDGDPFRSRIRENNLPVDVVFFPEQRREDMFFSELLRYLRFFRAFNPDCIVFNQFFLNSFSLAETIAAFLAAKGMVYTFVHDCPPLPVRNKGKSPSGFLSGLDISWRKERLFRILLGFFSKKTIAVSRASCITLVTVHWFPTSRVEVVYHGVDLQKYTPAGSEKNAIRQSLDLVPEDTVIVSTARLNFPKRVGWLIEAFAKAAKERKDIQLLIAGIGEENKWLVTIARSLEMDIGGRIRFLGYRDDIPRILQASDIYVLPSETEGLSIACLEAMACGLVCIATDCGGMSEILRDGETGFLVEKSRIGVQFGLRKALALTPAERDDMTKNSRKFIADNYDLEINIRSGLKVLGLSDS